MINKTLLKEARDTIAMSKSLTTKWDVQTVSIKEKDRIKALKEEDDGGNDYRIVIYVS